MKCLQLLAACMAALVVCSPATSQVDRPYRIINLGDVGLPADVGLVGTEKDFTYTFGINEHAEMVGGYDDGTDIHAWMWIPNPRFNFLSSQVGVFLDLHDLADLDDESVANDLNDDGQVVGTAGSDVLGTSKAIRWDVDTWTGPPADIGTTDLHILPSNQPNSSCTTHTLSDFSVAMTVSDAATPVAVGFMEVDCENTGTAVLYNRAFRNVFDGSPLLEALDPLSRHNSWAFDINSVTNPRVVGYETGTNSLVCATFCDPQNAELHECEFPNLNPLRWDGSTFPPVALGAFATDEGGAARAVNEEDQGAGYGFEVVSSTDCDRRAVFWNSSGTLFNLGQMVSEGTPPVVVDSRAEGLSDEDTDGCVTVVGWDVGNDLGLIWYGDPDDLQTSAWCAERLENLIVPCADSDFETGIDVLRGMDINSYGHIVALGFDDDTSEFVALGLTCSGDLDGDFKVNGADRTQLLGDRCTGAACTATKLLSDLDCDDDVDLDDLDILLDQWSGTDLCTVARFCTVCESESAQGGGGGESESLSLETVISTLGFESGEAFMDWCLEADQAEVDACCELISLLIQ